MHDIPKYIKDIGNSLNHGQVVFFVGTGISYDYPSNIPLADDVTNIVLYFLCQGNDSLQNLVFGKKGPSVVEDIPEGIIGVYREIAKRVENSLGRDYSEKCGYEKWKVKKKSIRMEVLLQFVWDVLKLEVLKILEPFNESVPNKYHYFLAKALEYGNDVITTNYDGLIENACGKMKMIPKGFYYSEETFGEWLKEKKSGCLFKIHGALQDLGKNFKGESVVATLSEISGGLSENKRKVLLSLMEEKIGIFMGYSFSDYFDISPVLKESKGSKMIYYAHYNEDITTLQCSFVPAGVPANYFFNHRPFLKISGVTSALRDQIISYLSWDSYVKDCDKSTGITKDFYSNKIKSFIASLHSVDKARIIAQVFINLGLGKKAIQVLNKIITTDTLNYSYLFTDLSNAYSTIGKTTKSLKFLKKSLRILDNRREDLFEAYLSYCIVLINIGRDHRRRWDFGKAMACFKNVIRILSNCHFPLDKIKKTDLLKLQLLAYDYMGDIPMTIGEQIFAQLNLKNFTKYYFQNAEKIYQERKKTEDELVNMGIKSRYFDGEELYQRHLKTIRQFLYSEEVNIDPIKRYTEIENLVGRIAGLADTSHILLANKKISEAEKKLIEAKIIAEEICSPWDEMKLARQLGLLHERYEKDYSKSKRYYEESCKALSQLDWCRFTICMKIFLAWKIMLNAIKEWARNFI